MEVVAAVEALEEEVAEDLEAAVVVVITVIMVVVAVEEEEEAVAAEVMAGVGRNQHTTVMSITKPLTSLKVAHPRS